MTAYGVYASEGQFPRCMPNRINIDKIYLPLPMTKTLSNCSDFCGIGANWTPKLIPKMLLREGPQGPDRQSVQGVCAVCTMYVVPTY